MAKKVQRARRPVRKVRRPRRRVGQRRPRRSRIGSPRSAGVYALPRSAGTQTNFPLPPRTLMRRTGGTIVMPLGVLTRQMGALMSGEAKWHMHGGKPARMHSK